MENSQLDPSRPQAPVHESVLYGRIVRLDDHNQVRNELLDEIGRLNFELAASRSSLPGLPKINIACEVISNGAVGSTYLNVVRVEQEDDGSFTAITDHWPANAERCNWTPPQLSPDCTDAAINSDNA